MLCKVYNRRMSRVKLQQPFLPISIAFLLGLQVIDPSKVWTILLAGLGGMFIFAYIWSRSLGRQMELRRETRLGWVQVGGQIEERFTLTNSSLLPASYVEFVDQSTLPDFNANRLTNIGERSIEQWIVKAVCNQRGRFTLGGAQIRTGDPFGIFETTIYASNQTSILVLPQPADLPDIFIAPSGLYGESQPRRNALHQTIHASAVREYAHGDSMRMIHWPTTARMNKTFVRLMESAPEGNWWILLDLNHGQLLGKGWDSVEEQSIALAASLADFGLRERKAVGLIGNGRELSWLAPQKGAGQRWDILQALATAKPGSLTLSSLLERMHPSLGKHHSLIVITASQKLDWLKNITSLRKRGVISTALIFDLEAYGGASAGPTTAVLEQRGVKCHVIPRGMIEPPKPKPQDNDRGSWIAAPTGEMIPVRNSQIVK